MSSNCYRPPRLQERGYPEPMDLYYAESEISRVTNYYKLQTCNWCRKTRHYAYECSAPNVIPRTAETVIVKRTRRVQGVEPTLLRKRNIVRDVQKRSGSVGAENHTDLTTSGEFAGLLARIAPTTQSLCISASENEVSLITLKLEAAKDMSLRALVDCGASNNSLQR